MKCPTCGAENDAANRFCDQCGSRLEPSGASPQAQVALASQPTAAAATCPQCGATVLPGEAFCDECGATLNAAAPAGGTASNDAPTMYAPPTPTGGAAPTGDQGVVCRACGHQNVPGDRFCDNCGASLEAPPAGGATIVEAPTAPSDEELLRSLNAAPPQPAAPTAPTEPSQPVREPSGPPQPAQEPPPSPPQPQEAPPAEQPQPQEVAAAGQAAAPSADQAQADYQARRQQLEDEIARQQQIIAQFEQMQATFGAATPPAVTQGLAEARDRLARAQADFDSLQPPAPAIDPAEVARLNDEIARQQQIITQFEQMQATFGAATPPAVTQGLAEARDARAHAEAALAALGGGTAPSAPAAPIEAQAGVAGAEAAPGAPGTGPAPTTAIPGGPPEAPAPPPEAPTRAPAAGAPGAAPRLVLPESGQELPLPGDKREIIIGREDPISGIFPEIDLTPYGGESGGVSRQHARISRDGGQWTITDLNSTNYTRVDGAKIEPSVPVPIKDGTRLQFGRVAVTFRE